MIPLNAWRTTSISRNDDPRYGGMSDDSARLSWQATQADSRIGWRANVFSAADLHKKSFPEIAYVIPGLIPEGLSILAGRPKIGKSWLALDAAFAVASESPCYCLGDKEPIHGVR